MTRYQPQIDYAQGNAERRRRLVRRIGLVLLIVLAIAASVPLLMKTIERMRVARLFSTCAAMQLPSIVYKEKSAGAGEAPRPQWLQMVPSAWQELNRALQSVPNSQGTLFLHMLHTPDGQHEWLVGLDMTSNLRMEGVFRLHTHARTLEAGGRLGSPRYGLASDQSVDIVGTRKSLAIHSGVVDPADPSHFTIAYEADDQGGIIDGWINNDGAIVLEARDAPTTSPALRSPGKSR